jgi:tetratricopeptide (TPR) repeat protein
MLKRLWTWIHKLPVPYSLLPPPYSLWLVVGVSLVGGAVAYQHYTTRPGYLLARGKAALSRGNLAETWRYAEALEQHGHVQHTRLLRGEAWLAVGRTAAAEGAADLRRALRELARINDDGPLAAEAALPAGECLVRLGEQRVAADVLADVAQRQPDNIEAHRWLAAVYIDLNSPTQAIHHLSEWGRLAPDNGRPYRWIGLFYKDYTIQLGLAIEAYREALKRSLTPDDESAVRRELAQTLLEANADYQGALGVLDRCPESLRETVEIRTFRAESLWGLGRRDEAVALADEVLRAAPDYPRALRLRSQMYLATDEPGRARSLLEKAVALDPYDVGSRQHLIALCDRLNDPAAVAEHRRRLDEARNLWKNLTALYETAQKRPWDGQVRYEIALLCLKANRKEQAQTMLRAALVCDPNHQEARRQLEGKGGNRE